jgi:hypothetical protein
VREIDPFIAAIVKQSLLIFGGIAILGLFIAAAYGLNQYGKLQHAMTLNMVPPPLA